MVLFLYLRKTEMPTKINRQKWFIDCGIYHEPDPRVSQEQVGKFINNEEPLVKPDSSNKDD